MLKPRIRTQYNAKHLPRNAEDYTGIPSETVPDQSMSLHTILSRYTQGLPLTADGRIPIWHGEDDYLPDFAHLDLAEQEAIIDDAKAQVKQHEEKLQTLKKAAQKAKNAHQGPNVQRTTGDADDHGSTDQPDNPISEKNRPAGEADTRSTKPTSGKK